MDNSNNICKCRRCDGVVHEIVAGDTLYTLSRRYNVSVSSIIKANRGVNPYNLMIGEQLCIPMNVFVDMDTTNGNASNLRNGMNNSNGSNMINDMNRDTMNGEMSTNRSNTNDMSNMGRNMGNNINSNGNMNNSDMNLRNNMNSNMNNNMGNPWDMEDTAEYEIEFTGIKDDEEMSREMLLDEIISRKGMTLGKFAEIIKNM